MRVMGPHTDKEWCVRTATRRPSPRDLLRVEAPYVIITTVTEHFKVL